MATLDDDGNQPQSSFCTKQYAGHSKSMLSRDSIRIANTKTKLDDKIRKATERHNAEIIAENEKFAHDKAVLERRKLGIVRDELRYANESEADAKIRQLKHDRRSHHENVRIGLTGERREKFAKKRKSYNYYKIYRYFTKMFKNIGYPLDGVQVGVSAIAKSLHLSAKTVKRGLDKLRRENWLKTAKRGGSDGPSRYVLTKYPMHPAGWDEYESLGPVDASTRGQDMGSAENAA